MVSGRAVAATSTGHPVQQHERDMACPLDTNTNTNTNTITNTVRERPTPQSSPERSRLYPFDQLYRDVGRVSLLARGCLTDGLGVLRHNCIPVTQLRPSQGIIAVLQILRSNHTHTKPPLSENDGNGKFSIQKHQPPHKVLKSTSEPH
jgi:hypothetical protein